MLVTAYILIHLVHLALSNLSKKSDNLSIWRENQNNIGFKNCKPLQQVVHNVQNAEQNEILLQH